MNIGHLADGLGLDEPTTRKLLGTFLTATDSDLRDLKNAVQAGQIASVSEVAHHIKGAAANLDLEAIRQAAYDLEMEAKSGSLENVDTVVAKIDAGLTQLRAELT